METATARITAERFLELAAHGAFQDRLAELVDGAPVVSQPLPIHAVLHARLLTAVQSWVAGGSGRGLVGSQTAVIMGEHDVYGPDVVWISEEHRPTNLSEPLARIPDLCAEIRSPTTWRFDIGAKKRVYESGGLAELWLVDHVAEQIYAFRRSTPAAGHFDVALELGHGDTLTTPLLPGFALPLEQLFQG